MYVKFLIEVSDEGDESVMAFFPYENYFNHSSVTKVCYTSKDKHTAATKEYAESLRPATYEEYESLYKELQTVYNKLRVL